MLEVPFAYYDSSRIYCLEKTSSCQYQPTEALKTHRVESVRLSSENLSSKRASLGDRETWKFI